MGGAEGKSEKERLKQPPRDFPGGPVVKTSPSNSGSAGSGPGWGVTLTDGCSPTSMLVEGRGCLPSTKD